MKTNLSYKNDNNNEKYKKIEIIEKINNYKTNKNCNNIKIKERQKPKRLNRINSQENNFSKKFNINNNNKIYHLVRNSESISIQGNESMKEEILNKDKKINYNINNKFKEKVMLLLNLCRNMHIKLINYFLYVNLII